MKYVSRETKRVMWMAEFDLAVVNRFPALSGRISWADATHMFNIGLGPQDAVDKYLLNPNNLPENVVRLVHF